jgi:hypothetical protein
MHRRQTTRCVRLFPALAIAHGSMALAQTIPNAAWISQFGLPGRVVHVRTATSDPQGLFIAGQYSADILVARFNRYGDLLWVRLFACAQGDYAVASAPDGRGGVYIGGRTTAALAGPASPHGNAWMARYDGSGDQVWVRQFGMWYTDRLRAMAPHPSGGFFAAGDTANSLGGPSAGGTDAFLARYDSDGVQLWMRQFGTPMLEYATALSHDGSGGVFIGGVTEGSLGSQNAGMIDAYVARYDGDGNRLWLIQFGGEYADNVTALAFDGAGGVFVAGDYGYPGPIQRMFLARVSGDGMLLWRDDFGTADEQLAASLAPDGQGGVFVGGYTRGSLGGPNAGWGDVFLGRYDATGVRLWMMQLGTVEDEEGRALAPDHFGGVYVAGDTRGNLGGPKSGNRDAFAAHFPGESAGCYANCDGSKIEPILNVEDFTCFIIEFAAGQSLPPSQQVEHYANCDGSTIPPILNINDFTCFINIFAQGCP